jgi:GNAT superfamily N-acetyltransferase
MDRAAPAVSRLAGERGWTVSESEAMVCRDLSAVPDLSLDRSLRREEIPVHSGAGTRAGLDLLAAAEFAIAADPTPDGTAAQLAGHLGTMVPAPRLLAATDASGRIRATAGCRVSGPDAAVFFVNTDPGYRRRGIGAAMTATVLRAAHELGATGATLDASAAGASVYRRLGFESAGVVTKFLRNG